MANDSSVELRGQSPRLIADVLDAISARKRIGRWELVLEILGEWADERVKDAIAIQRVTGGEGGGK